MSATEQQYYEMLIRTDHPVYFKDYSVSTDINSPINSIWNRILADQLVIMRAIMDEFQLNIVPDTVTEMTIADWEGQYFGFIKTSTPFSQRVTELLIKYNRRFKMSVDDVISLSQSIVGITPLVVRNISRGGWNLGNAALGITTVLSNTGSTGGQGLYLVSFTNPVDSTLLAKLDEALTRIEKAGSRHVIKAPVQHWLLGRVALGIDTTL